MRFFASGDDIVNFFMRIGTTLLLLGVGYYVFTQGGFALYAAAGVIATFAALEWDTVTTQARYDLSWWRLGILLWPAACVSFVCMYEVSRNFALFALMAVTAMDIGGYFVGKLLGGPLLWEKVSPKKTWSGLIGGVALAIVCAIAFAWYMQKPVGMLLLWAPFLALISQCVGDMGTSAVKRHFGVKDWGETLPGHGGMLDRFDGHLVAWLCIGVYLAAGLPLPL